MKKLIWLTTFMVLFMAFVLPAILALFIKIIPANDQPAYSIYEKRSIYGKRVVLQEFISQDDNLTGIGLSIGNPNLKNKKDIILTLYDEDKNLIRTSVLNGLNISDGSFVKFIFSQIVNSKDKKYLFTVSSEKAGPEEVIYMFPSKDVPSWIGNVEFENGELHEIEEFKGGLPLVTYHNPKSKLQVIGNIYSSFFGRVF